MMKRNLILPWVSLIMLSALVCTVITVTATNDIAPKPPIVEIPGQRQIFSYNRSTFLQRTTTKPYIIPKYENRLSVPAQTDLGSRLWGQKQQPYQQGEQLAEFKTLPNCTKRVENFSTVTSTFTPVETKTEDHSSTSALSEEDQSTSSLTDDDTTNDQSKRSSSSEEASTDASGSEEHKSTKSPRDTDDSDTDSDTNNSSDTDDSNE